MKTRLLVLLSVLLLLAACGGQATPAPTAVPAPTAEPMPDPTAEPELQSIVEIAVGNGSFDTLVAAVQAAGLAETLSGEGTFTVFAPTDEAFAALPEGTVDALLADPQGALSEILLYHVVGSVALAADVVTLDSVTTLNGNDVTIEVVDGGVVLNGSVNVVTTDIIASNGVIHVIDAVLLPPSDEPTQSIAEIAVENGSFNTLVAALDAAGLVETLSGEGAFTVFAPTDEAFAALPEGTVEALLEDPEGALTDILLYHVVDGVAYAEDVVTLDSVTTLNGEDVTIEVVDGGVVLNGTVNVIVTDIMATNGVIHVIDAVLIPAEEELLTIAEIAIAAGDFDTLVAALTAADLAGLMADPTAGPFTVFAPTDEAFAALPEGTIEALLDDIDALTAILLYHVVDGDVPAETVVTLESATTLAEWDVTITVTEDGRVFLNDTVEVIVTDIIASNGIIHVIDTVLLPPAEEELLTIAEIAIAAGDFDTLVAALTAADLADLMADPTAGPFTVFAPTDEAFAALPEGTIEALLADIDALTAILLYHVVDGAVPAETVVTLESATTLAELDVTITVTADGRVFLNDTVEVIVTDIIASNGIIHVIDTVLLPPAE